MIKQIAAVILTAATLAACTQASDNKQGTDSTRTATVVDSANAPVMKFKEESHDFGKIKQGDKVTYEFQYTNTGKSPLIIADAYATCGCTTPEIAKEPVQPGQSSTVKVTFNSAGKEGLQDKVITVVANTVPANNRVHLTGEVLAPAAKKETK
jgi:hypothetical protein